MNIEEFFQLSAGKWFSHRTSHHPTFKQSKDGKSDIIIETLATDDPQVVKLCQQHQISPSDASCAARVTWNGTMEWDATKHSGSTVLVSVPDADHPDVGKLLQETGNSKKTLIIGHYKLGQDEALTLTTEDETMWSEERLWFASPNLRMRVSVLKQADGLSMASFSTEIRMGGSPAATTAQTANSASS
ncbi:phycobiliprotein lyase [Fortiea contorta]|uniref:phycobiliprotein lyase n=1 Tax=Fortiea contorta TaxID=1892405 RepID=UPI0003465B3C|nr:phycobiliprotein lyase [Fortiea contorta]